MKRYSVTQSFMISEVELLPLTRVAKDRRVSKSYLIRELIRKGLATQKSTEAAYKTVSVDF